MSGELFFVFCFWFVRPGGSLSAGGLTIKDARFFHAIVGGFTIAVNLRPCFQVFAQRHLEVPMKSSLRLANALAL